MQIFSIIQTPWPLALRVFAPVYSNFIPGIIRRPEAIPIRAKAIFVGIKFK